MVECTLCTCSCTFFCFFLGANIWSYSSVYSRSHLLGFLRRFFSDRTAKRGETSSVLTKKFEGNPTFSCNYLCASKGTEIGNSQKHYGYLLWFILCKIWEKGDLLLYPHTHSLSNVNKIKLQLVSYSYKANIKIWILNQVNS